MARHPGSNSEGCCRYEGARTRAIRVGGVEQVEGHLARDHVGLVAVGDCEQHVRVRRARAAQHVRVRRGAGQRAKVEMILKVLERFGVAVDDGDVVGFARERRGGTELPTWPAPRMRMFMP